jgi:HEAT repeats
MSMADGVRKGIIAGLVAGLTMVPVSLAKPLARAANFTSAGIQEPNAFAERESEQDRQDREQEKRDREQEARDREQEKKDREQDRLDRLQELYDGGREELDEDKYQQAEQKFNELVKMNGPQTDAALYWRAYAENRQGKRDTALATIAEVKRRYPQSRWKRDAEALEIEIRNRVGPPVKVDDASDDELFILAFQGLMNSNPEAGIKKAEQILSGPGSPKRKSKVLFVVAQHGSKESLDLLGRIAQGQSNPELQRKAVEQLGIFGGSRAENILVTVYTNSSDAGVKRAVIQSYMISGNKEKLFQLAKGEKDDRLKRDAIQKLGLTGGTSELQQLYQADASTEARLEILQAFFLAGDSEKMVQAAQGEKDPGLRRAAIRNLGLMGKSDVLQSIYAKETDRSLKEEVLNAYFIGGNAHALVAAAKSEKDPELRKRAVEKLSLMNSKEGSEYLMELLNK